MNCTVFNISSLIFVAQIYESGHSELAHLNFIYTNYLGRKYFLGYKSTYVSLNDFKLEQNISDFVRIF